MDRSDFIFHITDWQIVAWIHKKSERNLMLFVINVFNGGFSWTTASVLHVNIASVACELISVPQSCTSGSSALLKSSIIAMKADRVQLFHSSPFSFSLSWSRCLPRRPSISLKLSLTALSIHSDRLLREK